MYGIGHDIYGGFKVTNSPMPPVKPPKKENPMSGDRYNEGKPRMSLLPYTATKEIAKVLTFGAQKYAPWNWTRGLSWMECCDSLERHIGAWKEGEDIDPESGIHHLAHAGCNVVFLLFFSLTGRYESYDDRLHKMVKIDGEGAPCKE